MAQNITLMFSELQGLSPTILQMRPKCLFDKATTSHQTACKDLSRSRCCWKRNDIAFAHMLVQLLKSKAIVMKGKGEKGENGTNELSIKGNQ